MFEENTFRATNYLVGKSQDFIYIYICASNYDEPMYFRSLITNWICLIQNIQPKNNTLSFAFHKKISHAHVFFISMR